MSLLLILFILLACSCSDETTPQTDGDIDNESAENEQDSDQITDGDSELEAEPVTPTSFKIGYGEIDITPFEDFDRVLVGSYGIPGLERAMKGVHDPLWAQAALIVNNAGESMLLITVDLCGYMFEFDQAGPGIRELRENIVNVLKDKVELKPENIVLTSSHNHTSTDLFGSAQDVNTTIPRDLLEWHVEKITKAAVDAAENIQDATLLFAETELPGYAGRDQEPLNSGNYCSEVVDDSVIVMQAKDANGDVIVTIANYTKHPTQIDWTILEASADFIYGYREHLSKQIGGKAMYIQGFEAAVHDGPRIEELEGEPQSYEKAYNMGVVLAEAVFASFENLEEADEFEIQHKEEIVKITSHGFFWDMENYMGVHMRTFEPGEGNNFILKYVPVSWHKLGPAQFVAWPGEPSPEYSLKLKARMSSKYNFMVGLANDQISYIVDPQSVEDDPTGKLLVNEVAFGPGLGAGETLMESMERMEFLTPVE